jgi:ADP-ribose pyrophosphatase YjhB (NUDIX family)
LLPKLLVKPYVWADHRPTFSVVVPLFSFCKFSKNTIFWPITDVRMKVISPHWDLCSPLVESEHHQLEAFQPLSFLLRGVSPAIEIIALIRAFGVFYCRMPKPRPKITRTRPTKEVSVMAWIEDAEQKVLLVRQAVGLRLWTLPGGKVKQGESLVKALRRELYEETGLRAQIGSLLGVLDRRDKDAITLLFVAVPNKNSIKTKQKNKEIKSADFQASLPKKASPSAKYFWSARRGPVKKVRKVRASTHQFPPLVPSA